MHQVEIIDIDNKKYMILNEISDNGDTFFYLVNIINLKDFLINLDNEEEFDRALNLFNKKKEDLDK